MSYAIVWFRRDLRLQDNPALRAALDAGHHPIPLYIDAPHEEGEWTPGAASRTWRHRSLAALEDALRALGSGLVIRAGDSAQVLDAVIAQTGAVAVYWNRKYEPATQPRDAQIKRALRERGIEAQSCNCALLFEPWQLSTQQGGPYKVFTPFWRNALTQLQLPATAPAPRSLPPLPAMLKTDALDTLQLVPSLNWDQGFWEHWHAGEAGAHEMLEFFIDGGLSGYRKNRDRPDRVGTSQLSPHLHFGEIAPWRIASALEAQRTARNGAEIDGYIRQLGWRDFAYHLLHHFPDTTNQNLNPRFEGFDWAKVDPVALQAWQRGRTGIPIVDAGMRQLWHTGWMHNRVRMIVASFCASICASTGSKARAGSGTRWWMRTWPTTRWAGSGWPAPAPMRRPISACSIQ